MDSINAVEDDSLLDESTYLTKVKNTQIIDAISTKKQLGTCGVCGEDGDGFFFGALVCLPCKVKIAVLESCSVSTIHRLVPVTLK